MSHPPRLPFPVRRRNRPSRSRRRFVLAAAACGLAVCGAARNGIAGKVRVLSDGEMDRLTAGAVADANAAATARTIGPAPSSGSSASAVADSGGSPIAAGLLSNYATAQTLSYGSNALSAEASGTGRVFVDGGNGGAGITAAAQASGTTDARTSMQLYAVSTGHADFAFGTVTASACCGAGAGAKAVTAASAGGSYTTGYLLRRQPGTAGGAEQAVDVAVLSSTLPIADAAQIAAVVSARVYAKY